MKREVIDRDSWDAMLTSLDGDAQEALTNELTDWLSGKTCPYVNVQLDSLGRLNSESSPYPADFND